MMSDDIDIEEHDLLDDPRVQEILPAITGIKTELDDYDDCYEENGYWVEDTNENENLVVSDDNDYSNRVIPDCGSSENTNDISYKIILGSKPSHKLSQTTNNSIDLISDANKELNNFNPNGSNTVESNSLFIKNKTNEIGDSSLDACVLLEDWGPMLNKSKCYCKICRTLFATENCYDYHKMFAHSLLSPIENRYESSDEDVFKYPNTARKSTAAHCFKCDLCPKTYTKKSNLLRHQNNRYTHNKNNKFEKQTFIKSEKVICKHCNEPFNSMEDVVEHLYKLITVEKYKCNSCCESFSKSEELLFHMLIENHYDSYRCQVCSYYFVDKQSYISHLTKNHGLSSFNDAIVPFDPHCHHCEKVLTFDVYNNHITMVHRDIFERKCYASSNKWKIAKYSQNATKIKLVKAADEKLLDDENNSENEENFHEFSNIITVYNSFPKAWHILFQCRLCDVVTDKYDSAIEHSQKHLLRDDQSIVMQNCKDCNLNFLEESFDKHSEFHAIDENVNIDTFKILTYDSTRLLFEDWLEVFSDLPDYMKNIILKHSIYGENRDFIMKVINEGPAELTLYKCGSCLNCVGIESVRTHVINRSTCSNIPRSHQCSICEKLFFTKISMEQHEKTHSQHNLPKVIYRIVLFNDTDIVIQKNKSDAIIDYYICEVCNLCVRHRFNIPKHACNFTRSFCAICNLYFYKINIKHRLEHETNPNLNNKKLQLDYFKPSNPWLYVSECFKCGIANLQPLHMFRHVCKPKVIKKTCSLCDLLFDSRKIRAHMKVHNAIPNFKKDNVKAVIRSINETVLKKFNLYNCKICKALLFPHKLQHDCTSNVVCVKCNFKIPTQQHYRHESMHNMFPFFERSNITTLDYVPPKQKQIKPITAGKYTSNEMSKFIEKKYDNKDIVLNFNETEKLKCVQCNNIFLNQYKFSKHMLDVHETIIRLVYKCQQCNYDFLTFDKYKRHIIYNHKQRKNSASCKYCGLNIFLGSMAKHTFNDHVKNNLTAANYFYVVDGKLCSNTKNNKPAMPFKKEKIFKRKAFIKTKAFKSINVNKHIKKKANSSFPRILYECEKCHVNYQSLDFLKSHLKRNHVMAHVRTCKKCGLRFAQKYATKHILNDHRPPDRWSYRTKVIRNGQIVWKDKNSAVLNDLSDYHCESCDAYFISINSFQSHLKKNHFIKQLLINCLFCGRRYLSGALGKHFSLVHKVNVSKTDMSIIMKEKISKTIFKCAKCQECFFDEALCVKHNVGHPSKSTGGFSCTNCGLKFSKALIRKHFSIHHNILKLRLKDMNIVVCNKKGVDQITKSDIMLDRNASPFDESSEHEFQVKKPFNSSYNEVFKCYKCDFYYMTNRTCEDHIANNHEKLKRITNCDICGFMFSKISYLKHKELHHDNLKLNKNEIMITIVRGTRINVHKCTDCKVAMINKIEAHNHLCYRTTDLRKCAKCKLFILKYQMEKHLNDHKTLLNGRKLHVMPFSLTKYEKMKIQKSMNADTESELSDNDRSAITEDNNEKNVYLDENDDTAHESLTENFDLDKTEPNDQSSDSSIVIKESKKFLTEMTVYKCSVCNVHYTIKGSCLKHTFANHFQLGQTRLVNCIICNLQFTYGTIPKHMLMHSLTDSKNYKIVVEEYSPDSSSRLPKINVYYFSEKKIQSKLITTTTSNDIDDETSINESSEIGHMEVDSSTKS